MCGIAGLIGKRNYSIAKKLLDKIRHRGPDGDGIWLSLSNEAPVSLCHARLAILDLSSSGSQPFHSRDGRYVIVFNGEIYNFLELKSELIARYNIVFKSESDTEVLLQGIIAEGLQFLNKCNGMWAFCFWDRHESKAILCRDRFGIKPLYYTKMDNGGIGFSSEMKGLSPLLHSVSPSPFIDQIFTQQFNYEFSEICAITGISRLPAGSYAIYEKGELSVGKWWNSLDNIQQLDNEYSSHVEHWRDLFLDSVRLRMRSDVRIGTALSGGLDSSSVLAVMSRIGLEPQLSSSRVSEDWHHGICCSYPDGSLDETRWARMVSESCGVPLTTVAVDPLQSSWNLLQSLAQVEDPYLTMPLPMLATYQAIKRQGISVSLDGHGADELFSGYGHLQSALRCAKTIREYKEIVAIDESTRSGVYSSREKINVKRAAAMYVQIFLNRYGIFPKKILRSFFFSGQNGSSRLDDFSEQLFLARVGIRGHEAFKEMDVFSQVLYEIFHLTILPTLLRNYDRYSMANGLEIRMPFMDWRLVCFTFSLPWQAKLGGTFTKRIQRDALTGVLCDPVRLRRDKIGWNAPAHDWFRGPLKPYVEDLLSCRYDAPYFNKYKNAWISFAKIQRPTFADGQQLWNSILPHLWLKSLEDPIWS